MKLKDARRQALALVRTTDEDAVAVWRMRKRVFAFAEGYGPRGCDLVMLVHSRWAKNGWYDEHYPEWV